MAIGDLISSPPNIGDSLKFLGEVAEGDDLASAACFDVILPSRRSLLPRRLNSLLQSRFAASRGRKVKTSLLTLLNAYHDSVVFGSAAGVERIATPFTSIFLSSGPGGVFDPRRDDKCHTRIEKRIRAEYGDYIDDLPGLRVRCRAVPDLSPSSIAACFGRGVFLPLPGETPMGALAVRRGELMETPRLPDGEPVGIYRGQSAIAFGPPGSAALASSALIALDPACHVLILQPPVAESAGRFMDIDFPGANAPESSAVVFTDTLDPPPGVDMCWRVTGQGDPFDIELTADTRVSRLHATPLAGSHFEIVGVRSPPLIDTEIDRWWIDLDANRLLVGSNLRPRALSVVVEDRRLLLYDWSELDFDRRSVSAFRLEPRDDHVILRRAGGRSGAHAPLGYLAAPPAETVACFQPHWWKVSGYHLDWLDFAGAVETAEGILPLATFAESCWPREPFPPRGGARGAEFTLGPLVLRQGER